MDYNGYTIEIEQDTFCMNPREDDCNLTTLVLFHGRYDVANDTNIDHTDYHSWSEVEAAIRKQFNVVWLSPVYGYNHSGFWLSTKIEPEWWHYRWDGGQLGFVFVTREAAKAAYNCKRITAKILEQVKQDAEREVKQYNGYVSGDVLLVTISEDGETIDSCGGYLDYDTALEEAKRMVDSYQKKE